MAEHAAPELPKRCHHCAGPLSKDMETSSWTVTPLVRDSFSMIGSTVGGTAGAFYAFNHAMPVVRRYIKGPMWIHFLVGLVQYQPLRNWSRRPVMPPCHRPPLPALLLTTTCTRAEAPRHCNLLVQQTNHRFSCRMMLLLTCAPFTLFLLVSISMYRLCPLYIVLIFCIEISIAVL